MSISNNEYAASMAELQREVDELKRLVISIRLSVGSLIDAQTIELKREVDELKSQNSKLVARVSLSKKLVDRFIDELHDPSPEFQAEYSWLMGLDDDGALAQIQHDAIMEAIQATEAIYQGPCLDVIEECSPSDLQAYADNLLTQGKDT